MANPNTGCACGSGAHPRPCDLHPYAYRLHIAEMNVEAYLQNTPEAYEAMDELLNAIKEALKDKEVSS